jgi:hypothetical protein
MASAAVARLQMSLRSLALKQFAIKIASPNDLRFASSIDVSRFDLKANSSHFPLQVATVLFEQLCAVHRFVLQGAQPRTVTSLTEVRMFCVGGPDGRYINFYPPIVSKHVSVCYQ